MMRDLSERIDARLARIGITARAASLASGGGPDVIRDIKRAAQRGRQGRVNAEYLLGLCRVLQVPPEFFAEDFDDSSLEPPDSSQPPTETPPRDESRQSSTLVERLERRLTEVGLSANAVSVKAGGGRDLLRNLLNGKSRSLTGRYLVPLCRILQVPPEFFEEEFEDSTLPPVVRAASKEIDPTEIPGVRRGMDMTPDVAREKAESSEKSAAGRVPEIDVRGGMGAGGLAAWEYRSGVDGTPMEVDRVLAEWTIPPEYLRRELRVANGAGWIIEVQGDSMEPTLHAGDRVMIDTGSRVPSPPGVFALWDGLGVVVKRLEFVPNTDPMRFIISSDNKNHERYERTADELNVIGRVVWFGRRI